MKKKLKCFVRCSNSAHHPLLAHIPIAMPVLARTQVTDYNSGSIVEPYITNAFFESQGENNHGPIYLTVGIGVYSWHILFAGTICVLLYFI